MFPSFNLFGKEIAMYSIMAAAGIITSGAVVCRLAKRRNILYTDLIIFLMIACIGVYLGGMLLYAVTQWKLIFSLFQNFSRVIEDGMLTTFLSAIFGGSVFYGGLLGGIAAGLIYLKKTKRSIGDYADFAAMAAPLFHVFGRIGCFLGGCCYGVECGIGFVFTDSLAYGANGVRRFPIQLVEAGFELLLFLLILCLFLKGIQKRRLFLWYLLIYPVGRFIFEFFRGDEYRGFVGPLSTSQFISIFVFAATLTLLIRTNVRYKREKLPEKPESLPSSDKPL